MAIELTTNIDVNTNKPTVSKENKATLFERDSIPTEFRYEGLRCYVQSEEKEYQLRGGITNSDWVDTTTTDSSNIHQVKYIGVSAAYKFTNAIPANSVLLLILVYDNDAVEASPVLDIGETLGGDEIYDSYEVGAGMNIIDYKKYYLTAQDIFVGGNFDGATLDFYITYQTLI